MNRPALLLTLCLVALLASPAALANPVRVTRAEVRCVTVTTSHGALRTRCTVLRISQEAPAPVADAEVEHIPDADAPCPLDAEQLPEPELKLPRAEQLPPQPDLKLPRPDLDIPRPDLSIPRPDLKLPRPAADRPKPAVTAVDRLSAPEERALALLNHKRAQLQLPLLRLDPAAVRAARAYSQQMCTRGFFDHTSPEGTKPWDRLRAAGAKFTAAGENIAKGYRSAEAVHQGWLDSPGHRKNRLNPSYTRVGIGRVECNGTPLWTELLMN